MADRVDVADGGAPDLPMHEISLAEVGRIHHRRWLGRKPTGRYPPTNGGLITLKAERFLQSSLVRGLAPYARALIAAALGAWARLLLDPLLGTRGSLTVLILAVSVAAGLGGVGPGLFAAGLTAAATIVLPGPAGRIAITDPATQFSLALFLLDGVVIAFLAGGLRTGRLRAEGHAAQAAALQGVAAGVARELRPQGVADVLLREGLRTLGAGIGVVGVVDEDPSMVRVAGVIGGDRNRIAPDERFAVSEQRPMSEAIRSARPIVLRSPADVLRRYPEIRPDDLRAGPSVVVPLVYEDHAIGAMYFRFSSASSLARVDRGYLLALGRQGGLALERARLREAEQAAASRAAFLSEASRLLGASLDVEPTIQRIAQLAVPEFADWCAVYLRTPTNSIRLLALDHVDGSLVAAVRASLAQAPPRIQDPTGVGAVIRTAESEAELDIAAEDLPAFAQRDPALRRLVELTRPRSSLTVPLIARGRSVGALNLMMSNSGRRFSPADVKLAADLGARAAAALDNSQLYGDLAARARQQAAAARLGQLALQEQDLEPVFDAIARELADVLEVEFTEVLALEPDADRLRLVAGTGWRPGTVGSAAVEAGAGSQAGYTLMALEPVIVRNLPTELRFSPPFLLTDHGVVSGMTVVVLGTPGPWGVLGAHSSTPRVFSPADVDLLSSVANVLAGAVERRRRLDAEREAHEVGRAFIGVVSHELRTPLTSIYAGAKLLRRSDDPAEREEMAADIEAEADRLYRLTEDLLVLTRLERGDLEVGQEPVLLSRLLERVIRSEQRWWPGVRFALRLNGQIPPVNGEDNYVEQVMRNLLSNAGKYSPAGSTVEVIVEQAASEILIRVLDKGRGVAAGEVKQLFSLFYRSPATAQQASGAGIGLFVCDQLINAMGGRIWARRRPEGGSEFGVALQVYGEEADEELLEEPERPVFVR